MKAALPFLIGLAIALGGQQLAHGQSLMPDLNNVGASGSSHAAGLAPDKYTNNTGLGTDSKNAGGSGPSSTNDESNTDESDDQLYHGRTSESENPMLRDEGRLHFKSRPKEKVQEVDSLKNLPTTAADRNFQGSLIHSGVASIDDVAAKVDNLDEAASDANTGDARFKPKQLTFKRGEDEQPKKSQAESSPSPSPSATASPQKKDSERTSP